MAYQYGNYQHVETEYERRQRARVVRAFSQRTLKKVCEMPEEDFGEEYGFEMVMVQQRYPQDFYFFKDNGANILAVAHLDTVAPADTRTARFVASEAGPIIYSRALDDRLGAYIVLDLLPKLLGDNAFDILLTVGEEMGMSTAEYFKPPEGKQYNWMIEFDRGGTDVVMYQYEDAQMRTKVAAAGARVSTGSFSDISYLEHLGIKGFNWGVGYQDYHGPRSHAYLRDTQAMVQKFLAFYEDNSKTAMPHTMRGRYAHWGSSAASTHYSGRSGVSYYGMDDEEWEYSGLGKTWVKDKETGVWSEKKADPPPKPKGELVTWVGDTDDDKRYQSWLERHKDNVEQRDLDRMEFDDSGNVISIRIVNGDGREETVDITEFDVITDAKELDEIIEIALTMDGSDDDLCVENPTQEQINAVLSTYPAVGDEPTAEEIAQAEAALAKRLSEIDR